MKNTTGIKTRRKYDSEFKQNILALLEDGRKVSELEESFGVDRSLIYAWRRKAAATKNDFTQPAHQDELATLKSEVLRPRAERDILKKALSIVSQK